MRMVFRQPIIVYKVWPLRAAARSTPERGRIGVGTVAETRAVHEYQQDAKWPNCTRIAWHATSGARSSRFDRNLACILV